jgi:hypothetical protein
MRKYFLIYEEAEAVSHIWLCNCSTVNFLIYEENLIFFFISVGLPSCELLSTPAAICISFVLKHTPHNTNQHGRLAAVRARAYPCHLWTWLYSCLMCSICIQTYAMWHKSAVTGWGQCSRVPMPSLDVTFLEQNVISVTGTQALYGLWGSAWRHSMDSHQNRHRAGILKESMGARNRGGIGLSYRPARRNSLAEFIPWNRFPGSINV